MDSIKAMAVFTEVLKGGDVDQHMDEIKNYCNSMSSNELRNIVLELIASVYMNCRLSVYMKVFSDAAIELDEKYDMQYQ